MLDFLLPRTDVAVVLQAATAFVILATLAWLTRSNRDGRIFVTGLTILTLALFGLRAVH